MDTLAFNRERSPSIIVGTRTGGQGKTLMSQVIHYVFKGHGAPLKVMAADTAGDEGTATKSKLARFLEGQDQVEELGIGVKLQSIRSDSSAALEYWDPLGRALEEGNVLVDVGANVLPSIWNWAVEIKAGRVFTNSPPIWLVIPVTAQAQSLVDAADLIRQAEKNREFLPIARYLVVFNESEGKFARLQDTPDYQDLMKLLEAHNAEMIEVERCKSSVWPEIQGKYISLEEMQKLDFMEYKARFGLSSFMASAAEKDFQEWLSQTANAFRRARLLPAQVASVDASEEATVYG